MGTEYIDYRNMELWVNGEKFNYRIDFNCENYADIEFTGLSDFNVSSTVIEGSFEIDCVAIDALRDMIPGLAWIEVTYNFYTGELEHHRITYNDGVWHVKRIA